jgi:hypothetical protein
VGIIDTPLQEAIITTGHASPHYRHVRHLVLRTPPLDLLVLLDRMVLLDLLVLVENKEKKVLRDRWV